MSSKHTHPERFTSPVMVLTVKFEIYNLRSKIGVAKIERQNTLIESETIFKRLGWLRAIVVDTL